MSSDGTPDIPTIRCGEAIARLRCRKGWSRATLVKKLLDVLEPDDSLRDAISEAWLARIENGRTVKLPRPTIEALCLALECEPQERWEVLLQADRNLFVNREGDLPAETHLFIRAMAEVLENPRIVALFARLRHNRPIPQSGVLELCRSILATLNIPEDKLSTVLSQPLWYQLALQRQFLRDAFAPLRLGVMRGSYASATVLMEEEIDEHFVRLSTQSLSDEFQSISIDSQPILSGRVILSLGELEFCTHFNDQGVATITNIPSRLLTSLDGPDLVIEILKNREM